MTVQGTVMRGCQRTSSWDWSFSTYALHAHFCLLPLQCFFVCANVNGDDDDAAGQGHGHDHGYGSHRRVHWLLVSLLAQASQWVAPLTVFLSPWSGHGWCFCCYAWIGYSTFWKCQSCCTRTNCGGDLLRPLMPCSLQLLPSVGLPPASGFPCFLHRLPFAVASHSSPFPFLLLFALYLPLGDGTLIVCCSLYG